METIPHTLEALLDLIPPAMLGQIIEYQLTMPGDTVDDWEHQHLDAADALCTYAERNYMGQLNGSIKRLRRKLNLDTE